MPKYTGFSFDDTTYTSKKVIENYDIIGNYKHMNDIRHDLDKKLKEVLRTKESIYVEQKLQKDANVYTGLLLTVLASSMIAYVFLKMK